MNNNNTAQEGIQNVYTQKYHKIIVTDHILNFLQKINNIISNN